VAFETAASLPAGVPVVAGVEVDSFGPDRVNAVLETLDSLPASLRRQVVTVSAPTATSVSFTLSGGATVVWGSTDQGARKATVLAALLHLRARQYDVSAPDAPVTMGG
jgi:cell division protein FtsQ